MIGTCNRGDLNREHTLSTAYTLTIEGLAEPTTCIDLQDALDILAEVLRRTPIRPDRLSAYLWMISGEGAADRVGDFMRRDGEFLLRFTSANQRYVAVIRQS
ncbi:hypothetical protein [Kitasatospora sp. NPDC005856]|uniref:hypothetical protein n=1 Tax=Kitasatospora sp. NPDC005856 TaxID=3154566 RepID=UPI0033D2A141